MAADMRSPNVSVTPINMEPYPPAALTALANGDHHHHQQHGGGGGSSEPPLDPSDAEVAQIDFQSSRVNMRSKKTKRGGGSSGGSGIGVGENHTADLLPRPMSWEGELSDCERDHMCIDDDHSLQVRSL